MSHDSFMLKGKDPTINQPPISKDFMIVGRKTSLFLKGRNPQKNQDHGGVGTDEQDKA